MNARSLRHAVAASDALRALYAELANSDQPTLAHVARELGVSVAGLIAALVRDRAEVQS